MIREDAMTIHKNCYERFREGGLNFRDGERPATLKNLKLQHPLDQRPR